MLIKDYRKRGKFFEIGELRSILKFVFVMVLIATILSTSMYFYTKEQKAEILSHKGITDGVIYQYTPKGPKISDGFLYNIFVNGSVSHGEHIGTWPNGGIDKFIGTHFPVIYDANNPKNNEMLLEPKDFKKYDMEFPDSLKWILPYFDHNMLN